MHLEMGLGNNAPKAGDRRHYGYESLFDEVTPRRRKNAPLNDGKVEAINQ
jgi:hypothetical protein